MDKKLPEDLSLALEALSRQDDYRARRHIKKLLSSLPESFESYSVDALGYFFKSNPKALDEETKQINRLAVNTICELWELEVTKPWLALKAYCLTGNENGVHRVIEKVGQDCIENNRALTETPLLVDSILEDNAKITALLVKKGAWRGQSALRLSLSKAAKLGHIKCLDTLLTKVPKGQIDATMLRDALIQTMTGKKINCFKRVCQAASPTELKTWKNQVKEMHGQSLRDPFYPSYESELAYIELEISKRKVIENLKSGAFKIDGNTIGI